MKLLSVVGARPQFIKAAVLSAEFEKRGWDECLVHTGQHYDFEMSRVFFEQLRMKAVAYNLEVGSASHAVQTAEMMKRLEPILIGYKPDWVLVFGDTNSTLAGTLVAAKLHMPVAHVEAGLRSFNREMPEEVNRIVADHLSDIHFAPTESAAKQLTREGIKNACVVGDPMVDLVLETARAVGNSPAVLNRFRLTKRSYAVVTVHRASNTDDASALRRILEALGQLEWPVVFPVHPRTRPLVADYEGDLRSVMFCEPLSYHDMVALERDARVILTDSGGVQKEAYALGVPCVTLRAETEWVETVVDGWNELAGTDVKKIVESSHRSPPSQPPRKVFGDGRAAIKIADALANLHAERQRAVSAFEETVTVQ